tara:strand:- start:525 stop:1424 length:900 start_codon:yes stop_codon:yes gene_type:complete
MENLIEEKEAEKVDVSAEPEAREEPVEVEVSGQQTAGDIEVEEEQPSQQEKQVSDSQKRIDRLTKLRREAERREKDAIAYAEAVKKESDELRAKMRNLDQGYVQEYSGRVESELESAKTALRQAMSIGDTDAAVEAQERLAQLSVAKERARQAQAQMDRRREAEPQQGESAPQQNYNQSEPQRPDPRAEEWAEQNDWFGKDEAMTYAAFGIHKRLVESEGFDPNSEDYYTELDRRIADEFPHKLGKTGQQSSRPVQTVASASRTAKNSGRRKVKLTSSQVAIAKKLGVPLEEYAKYVKE